MPSLTPAVGEEAKASWFPGVRLLEDPVAPILYRETASHVGGMTGVKGQALLHSDFTEEHVGLSAQSAVHVHMALPVFLTQEEEREEMTEPRELQTLTTVLCDMNTTPLACGLDPQSPFARHTPLTENARPLTPPLSDSASALTGNNGFGLLEEAASDGKRGPCWAAVEVRPLAPGIWDSLDSQSPAVLIENAHPEFPVLLTEGKDVSHYGLGSPPHAAWSQTGSPVTLPQDPAPEATQALIGGLETEVADSPTPPRELTTLKPVAQETGVLGYYKDELFPPGRLGHGIQHHEGGGHQQRVDGGQQPE
ncbi:hypothetical protein AAFF_G00181440 [Aldrovandia affinis]|uniref:Uncharacterized protein n=1 Tax=Aldrovandia affinis TaxID=143900 RepID=A0AAD7SYJ7_9TELE|nr:hypothetical protein AAFF_G00181440 [Aldrovandia affinis]